MKTVVQTLKKQSDELEDAINYKIRTASQFSDSETEELLALHHTALRIRADRNECPGLHNCTSVSKDAAAKVSCSLKLILTDLPKTQHNNNNNTTAKRIALSIAQDIGYAASKQKKLTLKHIGIGMALHQATRSKTLVELVHYAEHCISYEQVRRLDTTLAQENLQRQFETKNVPIPSNLKANKFFQFAADNIDIIGETLDGMGTFHATQMVTFQRGKKQPARKDFHTLHPSKVPILVQPKFIERVEELWYALHPDILEESNINNISRMCCPFVITKAELYVREMALTS